MKGTSVRVSMLVTVTVTILGCLGIVNTKATSVRVSMSVTVTMTIPGCPGIVNMKFVSEYPCLSLLSWLSSQVPW